MKNIKTHYWIDDSYITTNPPWKKAGDPPWEVRVDRLKEISKKEFAQSERGK